MTERKSPGRPTFSTLGRDEMEAILSRHYVGRIAFAFHDRVDLEPVGYAFADGWIYGRTSPGTKLSTIAHNHWVAFEVDETEGLFDWRSVVVKGVLEIIPHKTTSAPDPVHDHAIDVLRHVTPETFTAEDPVPFRHVIFRIHLDEVTGREARSAVE